MSKFLVSQTDTKKFQIQMHIDEQPRHPLFHAFNSGTNGKDNLPQKYYRGDKYNCVTNEKTAETLFIKII